MPQPIQAVLIGAGQRGANSYAPYALRYPERLRFVAVAEPNPVRRERFAREHNIPAENQFESWQGLLEKSRMGEVALVATQDWQHTLPAEAAMRAGYHVLLEKPMATTPEECRSLVQTSEETGQQLHICHVLRYTDHFRKIREIIRSGVLGDIVDVSQRENVGWFHMAHSYVRGNWRNSHQSSPMILAKCVHDLDILPWMLDRRCERLSSVGSLIHFCPENAPTGAPARCTDGCPAADTCPFYAPWIYRDLTPLWRSFVEGASGFEQAAVNAYLNSPDLVRVAGNVLPVLHQMTEFKDWPVSVLTENPTPENVMEALRTGPYGRCVYHCDNNVVDHQVVSMAFEGELSVTLTMHGLSHTEHRSTRIEGSRGRLEAYFGIGGSSVTVDEHRSDRRTVYNTSNGHDVGHGGGDFGLIEAFLNSIRDGKVGEADKIAHAALESHLMAFAAERARLNGEVVRRAEFAGTAE